MKVELDTIYNMDCIEGMKAIPDGSVDMVLCDLPYGTTDCAWDVRLPLDAVWAAYRRVIKSNAAVVLFAQQPFATDLINAARKLFRYEIIWRKSMMLGFLNANKMPLRGHENILVFYAHLPTYNPMKKLEPAANRTRIRRNDRAEHYSCFGGGISKECGTRHPSTVIEFSNWNGALFGNTANATKHPTQKPVDLCEYLIRTYTNEGDVVLDNCMGSGTTAVAAIQTGRRFIGFEKDADFYAAAVARVERVKRGETEAGYKPPHRDSAQLDLFGEAENNGGGGGGAGMVACLC